MKVYTAPIVTAFVLALTLSPIVSKAEVLLVDSFESASTSTTNNDGFRWNHNNRTSVVTMNPDPVVVWQNGPIYEPGPQGADWTARDGKHSLRFLYRSESANVSKDDKKWSEQRFDLGKAYRDVWIRYWLRVPTNFKHGTSDPSNHKLFAIWMDDYSSKGNGPTVIWEFWRRSNPDGSRLAVHWSEGGYTTANSHKQHTDFIYQDNDRGRWMEVILHVKAATNASSNDGVIEFWRRWENESQFTKFHEVYNANIAPPSGGPDGWKAGYLMGWANAAYAQDTEWLIDKFTVSSTPFTDVGGTSSEPRPPSNVQLRAAN
jgi:hypothetical protein